VNRSTDHRPDGRTPSTVANIGRVLWGSVFIASSIVNLIVTLPILNSTARSPS
jgi:hypothetical protein